MELGLDGKTALVSGASKGIGRAIAISLAAAEAASFVTGSNYRVDGGSVAHQ